MRKVTSNVHTHTLYCDGKESPEAMVLAAIEKGFTCLGFSGHSYLPFTEGWVMSPEATRRYIEEINDLKLRYRDQISILLGLELDYYSQRPDCLLDYTIGSVHGMRDEATGIFYPVDNLPEELGACIETCYHGDSLAMVGDYYEKVAELAKTGKNDIVGHLDLIRKLNSGDRFFRENERPYLELALKATEEIVKTGAVIEVNTGGVYRGYRDTPYPAPPLLQRIAELHGRVMITSDAHDGASLDFGFEQTEEQLRKIGFHRVEELLPQGFVSRKL